MNTYYIEVILHSATTQYLVDRAIVADGIIAHRNYYCFVDQSGKQIAYYPIINTIIKSIKYG